MTSKCSNSATKTVTCSKSESDSLPRVWLRQIFLHREDPATSDWIFGSKLAELKLQLEEDQRVLRKLCSTSSTLPDDSDSDSDSASVEFIHLVLRIGDGFGQALHPEGSIGAKAESHDFFRMGYCSPLDIFFRRLVAEGLGPVLRMLVIGGSGGEDFPEPTEAESKAERRNSGWDQNAYRSKRGPSGDFPGSGISRETWQWLFCGRTFPKTMRKLSREGSDQKKKIRVGKFSEIDRELDVETFESKIPNVQEL